MKIKLVIAAATMLAAACGTADIRPAAMKADIDPAAREKGREILERAFEAHGGLERWRSYGSVSAVVQDDWTTAPAPARWMFMVYDGERNVSRMRLDAVVGRFGNSRITFLNGPEKGLVWGVVDSERVYVLDDSGAPAYEISQEKQLAVENVELFPGLPFYLESADQVAHIDEVVFDGRPHDRVLISWGSFEPLPDVDQWIVWFDKANGRVSQMEFTVRDVAGWVTGVYYIDRYETVQGLVIPTQFSARFAADDPAPVHQYTYEDVRFYKQEREAEILPEIAK